MRQLQKKETMNWKIVGSNLKEAREQLQKIEVQIANGDAPTVGELQVILEHAYHHLNVAWNARNVSTKRYSTMTDAEFNNWGKFPKDIAEIAIAETAENEEK
jgi:hypothetical protein